MSGKGLKAGWKWKKLSVTELAPSFPGNCVVSSQVRAHEGENHHLVFNESDLKSYLAGKVFLKLISLGLRHTVYIQRGQGAGFSKFITGFTAYKMCGSDQDSQPF